MRISSMPRAVGRAARTMLSFAPLEMREIRITYNQATLPIATYTFIDARLLLRYFNGLATREQLRPYVAIEYARPAEAKEDGGHGRDARGVRGAAARGHRLRPTSADIFALRGENVLGGRFRVRPYVSAYLNDPSGAFKWEAALIASYDRPIWGDNAFLPARAAAHALRERERRDAALQQRAAARALRRRRVQGREQVQADAPAGQQVLPAGAARLRARLGRHLRGDVRRRRRPGAVPAERRPLGDRPRGRLAAAARLRGLVRLPGLPHRHRHRLAQLPHGAGRHRHAARRALPRQGRGRAPRGEAPLPVRLAGGRLVHHHQRQRHHLARHADEAVLRQGHLHVDAARDADDARLAGDRRLRHRAVDARRRPDGGLARRPVLDPRAAGAADAHARRPGELRRPRRRLRPARARHADERRWPDFLGDDFSSSRTRRRRRRLDEDHPRRHRDDARLGAASTRTPFDYAERHKRRRAG